ncbi:DUF1501 domain-containing protein [Cocleimonas flava]|uniref:Uncharacterized protein (DUF1501 family) n=1 Tax=Cocleimonas flava TaxID=634765 RepID=A0A4R1EXC2_9GAMM|nr:MULTISPECIES: DUF1501 domain-containing protein [Cocleimonas]MEB8434249.1 DUF1501 domain-containing protein [Cocleimonas sp. KMM 6892]MEC4717132.1 DUF1501 domain-containing protein [Cocleimonas sp. KMM 6895]MEC4746521.1 DUF1501 domain-containing protein [Cocleimonas sp. KMM 6896]TCJ84499.1 uncharacterized protein (DUF1501 family) [Cocleimonas flava]
MDRRDFLKYAGLVSASASVPLITPELAFGATAIGQNRIVVLVELEGGNDGFNTLVPYTDELYYKYRPRIAIKQRQVLTLDKAMGLHPRMKALMPTWNAGEMAWVQGVGYPNPVLSHFRSMDIWDSASNANQVIEAGWLSRVLPNYKKGLHGVALNKGQAKLGPLHGSQLTSVTMQNPKTFLNQIKRIQDVRPSNQTPAIAHVSQTQHQLFGVGEQLATKMGNHPKRTGVSFSKGVFGHSLESVAEMIISGVDSPVYKVTQDGFDTHSGQRGAQDNALYQVANGLASFRQAMVKAGIWDNVLVVTYSEFGRRAKENRGGGTDHGTASAQMILGGKVRGGIYGTHPNMAQLDANGNVRHTADFRAIYGTLAQRWWNQPNPWKGAPLIPFV